MWPPAPTTRPGAQRWSGEPLPRGFGFSDDTVVLHLQSATHWDSLSHIFHNGKMYNGYPAAEVTTGGAPRNGAERLKSTLVGRGALLDILRSKGVNWLEDGYRSPWTISTRPPSTVGSRSARATSSSCVPARWRAA